jgi:plasmid stabilization system protein ParE
VLTIAWSERALGDLNNIVAYIGADSEREAFAMQARLESAVEPAAQFPYMFRGGRVEGTREIVAHPNYIIIYRVTAEHIVVDAIIHARRQYPPET